MISIQSGALQRGSIDEKKPLQSVVDDLIQFAVDTANQHLVPGGINKNNWNKLSAIERFYLKSGSELGHLEMSEGSGLYQSCEPFCMP